MGSALLGSLRGIPAHQTVSIPNLDVVAVEVLASLVIGRIVVLRLEDARRDEDPYVDTFRQALGDREGKLKQEDVWTILGMAAERRTEAAGSRLTAAMSELGWKKTKLRFGAKNPEVCFVKGDQKPSNRIIVVRNWERETVEVYREGERQLEMPPF